MRHSEEIGEKGGRRERETIGEREEKEYGIIVVGGAEREGGQGESGKREGGEGVVDRGGETLDGEGVD